MIGVIERYERLCMYHIFYRLKLWEFWAMAEMSALIELHLLGVGVTEDWELQVAYDERS